MIIAAILFTCVGIAATAVICTGAFVLVRWLWKNKDDL